MNRDANLHRLVNEDVIDAAPGKPTPEWALNLAVLNSNVECFGVWLIKISSRAEKDLREQRQRNKKGCELIIKKIRDLSHGDFHGDNQRRISSSSDAIPIFQARVTHDARLVYQIDCVTDTGTQQKQCVRIFGVYTPAEVKRRVWDVIGRQLARKGQEYKNRCNSRIQSGSDTRCFIPAEFPPVSEECPVDSLVSDLLQVENNQEFQTNLILQRFIPFSRAFLNSILADLETTFPLELSIKERSIVQHPFSCYVLGRSGTGKTTAMIQKMLLIEMSLRITETKKRQLFVTQSTFLTEKVEEYFHKMLESVQLDTKTYQELKEIRGSHKRSDRRQFELVDRDEENVSIGLPSRFSELQDKHFPLFITFDRLCDLLENDLGEQHPNPLHPDYARRTVLGLSTIRCRNPITYNRFYSAYWSHFNKTLVKGLDPRSVFNEFLGVIKGSELTAMSPQRCLDRDTYERLSEHTHPTFSQTREKVYDLFESYRKMKPDYDRADRTHSLLRLLQTRGIPGCKLDYLYVDEAQDNLMIDALLLRTLCRGPNGLFWAGDTAQTIAPGCSFRFQDLTSMMYRVEHQMIDRHPGYEAEPPKRFCLPVNYRSHTGIVNCASSVVELIHQYWPYSIDILAPESGLIAGYPPVFLDGYNMDNLQLEQFLFGTSNDPTEFGATQCILVRNDAAKDKLQKRVGKRGIIVTVQESKGLEFNDVLLYNFFADSECLVGQWRLVLKGELETFIQRFDSVKYAGLCAELKSLYVAITRAKKNLWIVDFSEKSLPMKDYWSKRGLVKLYTPAERLPRLAESSKPEQWSITGRTLFERKLYSAARNCFHRASLPREEAVANAYALRDEAQKLPLGQPGSITNMRRRTAFIRVARAFLSCAKDNCKSVYYCRGAECFEEASENIKAAKSYYLGEDFTRTILIYHQLGMFDEAVTVLLDKEEYVCPEVASSVRNSVKLHYLLAVERDLGSVISSSTRVESSKAILKKARSLFATDEDMLKFAEDEDRKAACAIILLSIKRLTEAAGYLVDIDRRPVAIDLLLDDGSPDTTQEACRLIVEGLWIEMPFGFRSFGSGSPTVAELMSLSSRLVPRFLSQNDRDQIDMFRALRRGGKRTLLDLGKHFLRYEDFASASHCFGYLYSNGLPRFQAMELRELVRELEAFQMYIASMSMMTRQNPVKSPSARRLFRLVSRDQDPLFVPRNTFFYELITGHRSYRNKCWATDGGVSLTGATSTTYRELLEDFLRKLVRIQSESCRKARALHSFSKDHGNRSGLERNRYNLRIYAHLLQIKMLQSLASVSGIPSLQRFWIVLLYQLLNPLHCSSTFDLDPSIIPDFDQSLQVLNASIRGQIYSLSQCPRKSYLTSLLICLDLCKSFYNDDMPFPPVANLYPQESAESSLGAAANILLDQGTYNWPNLEKGIMFSRHVVDNTLPIDLSVFCNFLDLLCGLTIATDSKSNSGSGFHELLLPRSWWLKILIHPQIGVVVSDQMVEVLFDVFASLLVQLIVEGKSENLLYRSVALKEFKGMFARWGHVARLCRALCLFAHNLKMEKLKERVLTVFRELRSSLTPDVPSSCTLYFMSLSWEDVTIALYKSAGNSHGEQLILVYPLHRALPPRRRHWHVAYDHERDLYTALLPTAQIYTGSRMHPEHPQQEVGGHHEEAADPVEEGVEINDIMEEGEDAELEHAGEDREDSALTSGPATDVVFTPDQESAANVIKDTWRNYKTRTNVRQRISVQITRAFFADCLQHSETMEWPSRSHYKLLYLGPLPHLLSCLETLGSDIAQKKGKANKRLLNSEKAGIEKAKKELDEIRSHMQELSRLKRALNPTAEVHQRRDHAALKDLVKEAAEIVQLYPRHDRNWDVEIVVKAIVKESIVRAPHRPELRVEDEMDDYNDLYKY